MAANSTFCACQPMVLKASVTPTAVPSELMALLLVALMLAVLLPSTLTPSSSVVMLLSEMNAADWLRMRLVAIAPPTARPLPVPPLASATASRLASMLAASDTATLTEPAVSWAKRI